MIYHDYLNLAGQALVQATYIYDLARSAEHLTTHPSRRISSEVPRFASNEIDFEKVGFVYNAVSLEMNAAVNIASTGSVYQSQKKDRESFPVNIESLPTLDGSRVTPYIARTCIVEQYELLKKYLHQAGAPFNEKQVKANRMAYSDNFCDRIVELVQRRNELAHELLAPQATMRSAIEYSYRCLFVARIVSSGEAIRP